MKNRPPKAQATLIARSKAKTKAKNTSQYTKIDAQHHVIAMCNI